MIRFADCITLGEIRKTLDLLNCELTRDGKDYVIQPVTTRPVHTNVNILKFPQRRMQFISARLPQEPDDGEGGNHEQP